MRVNTGIDVCPVCFEHGLYLVDIYGGRHNITEESNVCISHMKCSNCKRCYKIQWFKGNIPTPCMDKNIESYLRATPSYTR